MTSENQMDVKLLAHTQLDEDFLDDIVSSFDNPRIWDAWIETTPGQIVSLAAIRTCYSNKTPQAVLETEFDKYFGTPAADGDTGTEADRLVRQIVASKHTSTLEHITFTFAISGVSRSLLAQLTRHRHMSFSVQSQRYVKFGTDDKSGGFDYVVPQSVEEAPKMAVTHYGDDVTAHEIYEGAMQRLQQTYDDLRTCGVPAQDARMVLPNAATTNLVMTASLRTLLEFYAKRRPGSGAQWEIAALATLLRKRVARVEPWTDALFEGVASRT